MTQIKSLSQVDSIADGDIFPLWDVANSDTRGATFAVIRDSLMMGFAFVYGEIPSGLINGVNMAYELSQVPATGKVALFYNGNRLRLGVDFTMSGASIALGFAPETGDNLIADYSRI